MSRLVKFCMRICGILIPIGIILIIIGFVMGAKGGIYFENGRIRVAEKEDYEYEEEYTDLKSVFLDMDNVRLVVERSKDNKFRLEMDLHSMVREPEITYKNDSLTVKQSDGFSFFSFSWDWWNFIGHTDIVTLYVPANADLEELVLDTSNGKIIVNDLSVELLEADTSNGSVTFDNVEVTKELTITTSNGKVDVKGIFDGTNYIKTSNGKVITDGSFTGTTTIKTSNGTVEFKNDIAKEDHNIVTKTSNGSVYVNGDKMGNSYRDDNGAENDLDIRTSNGRITIELR